MMRAWAERAGWLALAFLLAVVLCCQSVDAQVNCNVKCAEFMTWRAYAANRNPPVYIAYKAAAPFAFLNACCVPADCKQGPSLTLADNTEQTLDVGTSTRACEYNDSQCPRSPAGERVTQSINFLMKTGSDTLPNRNLCFNPDSSK